MFTRASQCSISGSNLTQSTPFLPSYLINIQFNIIVLSKHRLSKWSLPFRSLIILLYPFRTSMHVTCLVHLILRGLIILTVFMKSSSTNNKLSFMQFYSASCTSALLGRNILLSILFSNTVILLFFNNIQYQVTRSYKTIEIIIVIIIIIQWRSSPWRP
jgi:hypothetical protein